MVLEAERQGCLARCWSSPPPCRSRTRGSGPPTSRQRPTRPTPLRRRGVRLPRLLKLWDHLRERQDELSSNQFRKLCRAEYLNYLRVREWQDLHRQLRQSMRGLGGQRAPTAGAVEGDEPAPRTIHQSLLAGLLSHIGMKGGRATSTAAPAAPASRSPPARRCPSRQPRWVMAAELVETNRLWARVVARISRSGPRAWRPPRQAHLQRAAWDAKRGVAVAFERVTLYGLPLVAGRTVGYDRVDPDAARDLFIRHALVDGDWARPTPSWPTTAAGRRGQGAERPGPAHATSWSTTRPSRLLRRAGRPRRSCPPALRPLVEGGPGPHPDLLTLHPRAARRPGQRARSTPPAIPTSGASRPRPPPVLRVRPGRRRDGVTVHVPLPVLDQLDPAPFDWQVPGLRRNRRRPDPLAAQGRAAQLRARPRLRPGRPRAADPAGGPLLDVLARELAASRATPSRRALGAGAGAAPPAHAVPGGGRGRPTDRHRQRPRHPARLAGRPRPRSPPPPGATSARAATDGPWRAPPRVESRGPAFTSRRTRPWSTRATRWRCGRCCGRRTRSEMWAGTRRLLLLAAATRPGRRPSGACRTRPSWPWPVQPYPSSPDLFDDCAPALSTSSSTTSAVRCGRSPASPAYGPAWPTP